MYADDGNTHWLQVAVRSAGNRPDAVDVVSMVSEVFNPDSLKLTGAVWAAYFGQVQQMIRGCLHVVGTDLHSSQAWNTMVQSMQHESSTTSQTRAVLHQLTSQIAAQLGCAARTPLQASNPALRTCDSMHISQPTDR